jgi:glucose/arabinose dehydrogenase
MKKHPIHPIILCVVLSVQMLVAQPNKINLETVATNLISPVGFFCPKDGSDRKFILEQRGLIYVIDKNNQLSATPFLDVRERIGKLNPNYDERGLLGLAFHPNFKKNKKFYVFYTINQAFDGFNNKGNVSEFVCNENDLSKTLASEKIVLQIPHPQGNHNGGMLLFDAKGFLLIGLGDGGGAGDNHGTIGNAQDKSNLLGKILRIDINNYPYSIPTDNPFINEVGTKPEIYAYGLRNPWRFSIDFKTDRLFCGDVGQNKYEEVNIIQKGKNYGWRIMEASNCFNPSTDCPKNGLELPIAEYAHSEGVSVIGGYVYRGKKIKNWVGKYIFADWRGVLFSLTEENNKWKRETLTVNYENFKNIRINSMGEDQEGELYLVAQDKVGTVELSGKILKLIP